MKIAIPVMITTLVLSKPWSTKFLTHNSTVDIIEVNAAKDSAKEAAIMTKEPIFPPSACAKTSGRARKVIADEPPVTVPSGSLDTAKIAHRTVKPAMIEIELFARPVTKSSVLRPHLFSCIPSR